MITTFTTENPMTKEDCIERICESDFVTQHAEAITFTEPNVFPPRSDTELYPKLWSSNQ